MYLIVTATEQEMQPIRDELHELQSLDFLVTGMGPVESTLVLTLFLSRLAKKPRLVMNFGVGGAYPETGLEILDLALAEREVFGDLGICHENTIESFNSALPVTRELILPPELVARAAKILSEQGIVCTPGAFVTVNCTSGTRKRGNLLRDTFHAICENMEGASVARVCKEFELPCLELRCISNLVEDRDLDQWRIREAGQRCGLVAGHLVRAMLALET